MNHMKFESPDMTAQNIDRIAALFPNCITEMLDEEHSTPEKKVYKRAVNFELLKQMLSPDVVDGDEAYEFTWVGKKAAIVEANKPIRKTLRPCVAESKDWDTTENLYIEGDNLEVLKLLQESYLGKVKMIYIDPPYNTGNDFIYADDFMRSQEEENGQMGMYDEDKNRLFKNTDTNGRFHSDWCSMIYSRLMLARNLLTDDGIIFSSISEKEYAALKQIMQDVFGQANYVGTIIWKNATDNNPTNIAEEHEYILSFAKQKTHIEPVWKSHVSDVKSILVNIGKELGSECKTIEELQARYSVWYRANKTQLWPLDRYKYIDFDGVYTGSQSVHNPGKEGYRYDVLHPVTSKPCKQPLMGYRFPKETMEKLIQQGKIIFGETEDKIVELKLYASEYQEKMSSVFELDGRIGAYDLKMIFPDCIKAFTNPKPVYLVHKLISFVVHDNDIVLDFFSGSATTAHAVMQLNAEDGGHRKFIMVQLPEKCDEASEAYKAGYKNICEIGKERIRRAGEKLRIDLGGDAAINLFAATDNPDLEDKLCKKFDEKMDRVKNLDIGFRVLKLGDTNMKDVYYAPDDYDQGMLAGLESNIKDDRTDLDLLFGCLIDWGLPLSLPYKSEKIDGCTVHTYNDGDLIACFDANIPESVVKEIAQRRPLRAVFRDSGFASSPEKINVFEIFKLYMPEDAGDISKRVRVI
jgi:adenine-specific DNA-methyltransferase